MKVGLFGDSYACLTLNKGTAWFENLDLLKKYQIISYAKKGSDITYSYKLFLEHHTKFEKNLFFVTESTRHSFDVGSHRIHVSNIDSIEFLKNTINDFKVKIILNSLKDHYLYTMSTDLYDFGLAGMVDSIFNLRPDTIIIYGFYNHSIKKITKSDFYLSQVSLMELDQFGIDFDDMKRSGIGEGRSAHLTDANNEVLSKYIHDRLEGKEKILSLSDFIIPCKNDRHKYFSF